MGQGNKTNHPRKYSLNEDFFETIDSEAKAYWLDFLAADGHISDKAIILKLHNRDKTHVEKFRDALNSNAPITEAKDVPASYINLCSKKLVEGFRIFALKNINSKTKIVPTKSIYRISFGGSRNFNKLVKILYSDCSIALERKLRIATIY
jgi:hypothetical protein